MSTLTSPTLIARLQNADPRAWNDYVEVYTPLIAHWILRSKVADQTQMLDLIQDINLAVYRALPNFQYGTPTRSFRGWLATITRNRIRDYIRQQAARLNTVSLVEEIPADFHWVNHADSEAIAILVRQAIRSIRKPKMTETQKLAVAQHFLDGTPIPELAERHGLNSGTLRNLISVCRTRLKSMLSDEFADD